MKMNFKIGENVFMTAGNSVLEARVECPRYGRYTGNILLQKTFISDHLTKKKRVNRGELPQYYVEDSHECCPYVNTNAPP